MSALDLRFRLGRCVSFGSVVAVELLPTNLCTIELHVAHFARIICTPRRLVKLSGLRIWTDWWHLTQYPVAGSAENSTVGIGVNPVRKNCGPQLNFSCVQQRKRHGCTRHSLDAPCVKPPCVSNGCA